MTASSADAATSTTPPTLSTISAASRAAGSVDPASGRPRTDLSAA